VLLERRLPVSLRAVRKPRHDLEAVVSSTPKVRYLKLRKAN
jgi:hypothetical protein